MRYLRNTNEKFSFDFIVHTAIRCCLLISKYASIESNVLFIFVPFFVSKALLCLFMQLNKWQCQWCISCCFNVHTMNFISLSYSVLVIPSSDPYHVPLLRHSMILRMNHDTIFHAEHVIFCDRLVVLAVV